jgi:hypothetical protein
MRSFLPARGRARLAAVAVLLGVTLAGCGQASPGAVAYVDGTKITEQQLDDAVAGVGTTVDPGQQVSSQAVANAMIHGVIAEHLATQDGIAITDAQRDSVLKGSNLEPLLAVPAAKSVAYDVADQEIVSQKIGGDAYLKRAGEQQVTLNPRYGVLDPQQKLIVPDQSGSLAKPVAPSPSP